MSSAHIAVLTDANTQKGTDTVLRLEQMRAAFANLLIKSRLTMPVPLDIIAFKNREEYVKYAPIRDGQPISTSGFFLAGTDRSYVVLDLSDDQSWRVVTRPLAEVWLNFNYPPTQPWFDVGLTEYFSSLRMDNAQEQIGADPAGFAAILTGQTWIPIPKLFAAEFDGKTASTLQRAESWILMHYLISQNKLSEMGAYFGLVEVQHVPVEQAIQQAYGISAAQFEQAIRDYFHSLGFANGTSSAAVHQAPAPILPADLGSSSAQITDLEAQARVAEMAVRMPEHREETVKQLEAWAADPQTETGIDHRALGWVHLQKGEYDDALDELGKAADLGHADPWPRYYSAVVKYTRSVATGQPIQGQANMMVDLHPVLDWAPDFAEAYHLLGMARLQGGGLNAATESMRRAVELAPRNQLYLLHLAEIYLAAKKWDQATAIFDRLKTSPDPQIATQARNDLEDLPSLKKYGVAPSRNKPAAQTSSAPGPKPAADDSSDDEAATARPVDVGPDRRKTQYVKGRLLSVDCSQPSVAVVRVAAGPKTLRLRTSDYKSLLLVGADTFSCEWRNIAVVVNYKAGGKADGDMVSLELP